MQFIIDFSAPGQDALYHILNSILSQHLAFPHHKFKQGVINTCQPLVNTAIALHMKVAQSFLPTAIKFHYNFNLRDIANIFTVIMTFYKNFLHIHIPSTQISTIKSFYGFTIIFKV